MKGVYLLFLRLEERKSIDIGSLDEIDFPKGVYVYAGSARNSMEKRVDRHFSDNKKIHWHIDYLLQEADPFDYFLLPEKSKYECLMADILSSLGKPVPGFGCSDCGCSSHLFRFQPEDFSR